ncbi:MAG: hypothetical protein WC444_07050 [Candidatus Paceibacterota bacterium]
MRKLKRIEQDKIENEIKKKISKGISRSKLIYEIRNKFKIRACDVGFILYYLELEKRWNSRKEGNDEQERVSTRIIEISYLRTDSGRGRKDKGDHIPMENEREWEGVERRYGFVEKLT